MDIINQEDFNSGTSGTWSTFDVIGDDFWEFSSSFPNAFINGFGGDAAGEEDWLISPALDFSTTTDIMMTFVYSERFSGPDMEVFYSTDYSGTGNPNAATWTLLETLPDLTSSSSFPTNVDYTIDLSALSAANIYIAFKYTATSPSGGDAEAWRIDDICISGGDPN
ncbi:MAG: choice-of-anchor J domain-containing protein, partial [Bacteroidota bacterium]